MNDFKAEFSNCPAERGWFFSRVCQVWGVGGGHTHATHGCDTYVQEMSNKMSTLNQGRTVCWQWWGSRGYSSSPGVAEMDGGGQRRYNSTV